MYSMERVEAWLAFLEERGRKPETIVGYRCKLRVVLRALDEAGMSTEPEDIGEETLYYLKRTLNGSENTARAYIRALGYYVLWATGQDPVGQVKMLWNHVEPDRVFISEDDFKILYSIADPTERLVLLLGGLMGLRRFEIAELRYRDIDRGRMTVHGKGHGEQGKVAHLKVPPMVLRAIEDYTYRVRDRIPNEGDDSDDVILVRPGIHHTLTPYRREEISKMVQHLGERAGIHVTPHALRRLFCTTLHDKGVELTDIKTLMRHENVNTTINCYLRPNTQRLDSIMDEMGLV